MKVKLIAITKYLDGDGTPEELLEHAGRVCYRSQSRGNPGKFLQARIREGHESLIEHASATFEISGISRACSHQLVRHRLASYSQESQRYVDMSNPDWVTPPSIEENPEANVEFDSILLSIKRNYTDLRGLGISKEDARFVLPNATTTRIIVTMNFRSWRHFCTVRCSEYVQWEIHTVARAILDKLYEQAPSVFVDIWSNEIPTWESLECNDSTYWPEPSQTYGADGLEERKDGHFI